MAAAAVPHASLYRQGWVQVCLNIPFQVGAHMAHMALLLLLLLP
jgi:hypothetical protein